MLDESVIKSALIDKLFDSGLLHDAVLINELVVANWSRRADLAVANGKLHAFEIKSDLDNLRRLDGQVSTYLDRFDKVTVVTTPKHADLVLEMMPNQVEVWEACEANKAVDFRVLRRGKTQLIKCKKALLGFLLKEEMLGLIRTKKRMSGNGDPKKVLGQYLEENFSVKELRDYVLKCLKSRYKVTFKEFISSRQHRTKQEDLVNLSKSKLLIKNRLVQSEEAKVISRLPSNFRFIDLASFQEKYGCLPEGIPPIVLIRKSR